MREILTSPIDNEQIYNELVYLVKYFHQRGVDTCEVQFGHAWGNDYYSGSEWRVVKIALTDLPREIDRAAELGWGGLGGNDLFVTISPDRLAFRFCNDSDIHLTFEQPDSDTEHFYQRWENLSFNPVCRAVVGT